MCTRIVLTLSLLIAVPGAVMAQTVIGTVTALQDGTPLPGVSVLLKGTTIGTATNADGAYELDLPTVEGTLLFSFVGFRTEEVAVRGESAVDVQLREDILGLEEVVVTGVATSVRRSALAHSVGTVSAEDLVRAPAQTLERALNGKIAGLYISQNTGAPGGGINVNLRGTSTITGDTQPLFVVDGVIVDNSAIQSGIDVVTAATGAGSPRPQGQPSNRIADINPYDIANIEVLKGASASAIYGSKATNGVVIITTKRGAPGRTRITVSQQLGASKILKRIGFREFTAETAEASREGGAALLAENGNIDYEDLLYGNTGFLRETTASVSGGSDNTRFYVSALALSEGGIVDNTGFDKVAGRVNVEHRFGDRITIQANTNVIRSNSDRSITGNENQGSTTLGFAQVFTLPFVDLRPVGGVYPDGPAGANPLHTVQALTNNELVHRAIGATRLSLNLLRTNTMVLDLSAQGGADFYSAEHTVVSPPTLQYERAKDAAFRGISIAGETTSLSANFVLGAVHRWQMKPEILLNTSFGLQYEERNLNAVTVIARGLVETQQNIDQAASLNGLQDRLKQRERGFFVQEEVDLGDRIFLTAGLRADASSRIGDPERYHLYPKLSVSVRLSEYDFWESASSFANTMKLRLAFGRAGNLPLFGAKFTSLVPENVTGLGGVSVPARLGNAAIEPEITQELEGGFDLGFLNERAILEVTFYNQEINDLILDNSLPPSSGYVSQFINAGDMRTRGYELSLEITPLLRSGLRWNARFNFGKHSSSITRLDVDTFELGGFALALGQYEIKEGSSPTTIVGLDADGNKRAYGNETPDFTLSWNNALRIKDLHLGFLWDWKQGGDVINLGRFLSDIAGTSPDLDELSGQARLAIDSPGERYVEDGTYIKLREISLQYGVPEKIVHGWFGSAVAGLDIGLSGRNLLVFTPYSGYDPEVSQFGNIAIGRSVDTLPFPSARHIYFKIAMGF